MRAYSSDLACYLPYIKNNFNSLEPCNGFIILGFVSFYYYLVSKLLVGFGRNLWHGSISVAIKKKRYLLNTII